MCVCVRVRARARCVCLSMCECVSVWEGRGGGGGGLCVCMAVICLPAMIYNTSFVKTSPTSNHPNHPSSAAGKQREGAVPVDKLRRAASLLPPAPGDGVRGWQDLPPRL